MIIASADFRVAPKIGEVGAIQACRSSVARAREASNRLECLCWVQTEKSGYATGKSALPLIADIGAFSYLCGQRDVSACIAAERRLPLGEPRTHSSVNHPNW